MLDKQIIEESTSPYSSPLWVVSKKKDASGKQKWRIVVDFRKINEHTPQDQHPLPRMEEILESLGGAHYFSAFDLASGFYQIMMDEKSKEKQLFPRLKGISSLRECRWA